MPPIRRSARLSSPTSLGLLLRHQRGTPSRTHIRDSLLVRSLPPRTDVDDVYDVDRPTISCFDRGTSASQERSLCHPELGNAHPPHSGRLVGTSHGPNTHGSPLGEAENSMERDSSDDIACVLLQLIRGQGAADPCDVSELPSRADCTSPPSAGNTASTRPTVEAEASGLASTGCEHLSRAAGPIPDSPLSSCLGLSSDEGHRSHSVGPPSTFVIISALFKEPMDALYENALSKMHHGIIRCDVAFASMAQGEIPVDLQPENLARIALAGSLRLLVPSRLSCAKLNVYDLMLEGDGLPFVLLPQLRAIEPMSCEVLDVDLFPARLHKGSASSMGSAMPSKRSGTNKDHINGSPIAPEDRARFDMMAKAYIEYCSGVGTKDGENRLLKGRVGFMDWYRGRVTHLGHQWPKTLFRKHRDLLEELVDGLPFTRAKQGAGKGRRRFPVFTSERPSLRCRQASQNSEPTAADSPSPAEQEPTDGDHLEVHCSVMEPDVVEESETRLPQTPLDDAQGDHTPPLDHLILQSPLTPIQRQSLSRRVTRWRTSVHSRRGPSTAPDEHLQRYIIRQYTLLARLDAKLIGSTSAFTVPSSIVQVWLNLLSCSTLRSGLTIARGLTVPRSCQCLDLASLLSNNGSEGPPCVGMASRGSKTAPPGAEAEMFILPIMSRAGTLGNHDPAIGFLDMRNRNTLILDLAGGMSASTRRDAWDAMHILTSQVASNGPAPPTVYETRDTGMTLLSPGQHLSGDPDIGAAHGVKLDRSVVGIATCIFAEVLVRCGINSSAVRLAWRILGRLCSGHRRDRARPGRPLASDSDSELKNVMRTLLWCLAA